MKKSILKSYAKLIAKVGANVQKGQEVIIRAELDQPEFVTMLVDECYKLKAKSVRVEWRHQPNIKLDYKNQSLKTLSNVKSWVVEKYKDQVENLPTMIYLESEDPDGLNGINQEKVSKARQAQYPIIKPFRDAMDNKYQWCIAGVPGKKWAKKVFPNLSTSKAIEKLWEAILYTSRVTSDPIGAWNEHNEDLLKRSTYLNNLKLKYLHYTSSNGTDLKVGLINEGSFIGGGENTLLGVYYNPNIPTEEVFTSPMAGDAEGIVYATKPLSYQGELIENFSVTFKNGKVVDVKAEKNEELLKKLVSMDEGASKLGECALVPFDSPINNSGVTFFNTLYDENCCCHLALGHGFNNTLRNYEKLTFEECKEKGINDSSIHVDFMIGSKDLNIEGETFDGKKVAIFKDGNWAF